MKRITPRSTAAAVVALAIAAVGTPLAAQTATLRSGYVISWGKTAPVSATAGETERTASGYVVAWGKGDKTERASSGYIVSWARSGYIISWSKEQSAE